MNTNINLLPKLDFAHNQFGVYDYSAEYPAFDWKEEHVLQGFARGESQVAFCTLFGFGVAEISIFFYACEELQEYERVIAIPFHAPSGTISVEGTEEYPIERSFAVSPGHYRLTAAQYAVWEDEKEEDYEEAIHLYFELLAAPLEKS
ncbi:MAG: competence protein ComJ, partial [Candidatus Kapaibacterium sp.]